jgi:carbon-monoxide dehydrogenase medium subunit
VFGARHADGWRVAVIGATYGVIRWTEAEGALDGQAALPAALDHAELASDMHASADYRAHLAGVMLSRAVAQA